MAKLSMKNRYKMPSKPEYKYTMHIINSISKFYPTLFTKEEIELALKELGIGDDEDA